MAQPTTSIPSSALTLLTLPSEIRLKIWSFAFADTEAIPLSSSLAERLGGPGHGAAYDTSCHGCRCTTTDPHTVPVERTAAPLLTCRKIYSEAVELYQRTLRVHVCLISELGPRGPRACAQQYLRQLDLRIHMDLSGGVDAEEDIRHLWMDELITLPARFPVLKQLRVTAHLRPPVAYENLVDAMYLVGPLSIYPTGIQVTTEFDYISEDVMIDHPELGRVWYSDALEEHTLVIKDCMADEAFRDAVRNGPNCQEMAERMLYVSREHEQPWVMKLRRRKIELDRREAEENRRTNGGRCA